MHRSITTTCLYTLLSLLVFAWMGADSLAQEDDRTLKTYEFDAAIPIQECTFEGTLASSPPPVVQAPQDGKFAYLGSATDNKVEYVVIQFLLWDADKPEYTKFNRVSDKADLKYFRIKADLFDRYTSRVYATGWASRQLSAGTALLPIKIRFGGEGRPFEFTSDVTIGPTAGGKLRISDRREHYLIGLVGVGIASVELNGFNTQASAMIRDPIDRAAFSVNGGFLLEIDSFQFGAFVGCDFISQPHKTAWKHQGKPWLALGLGYNLLNSDRSAGVSDN